MNKITGAITGINGYVPNYVLTNKELESLVDTNDEWITTRTGVKERRILKDSDKATSDLAAEAIKGLLSKTNTNASEIDLIICATATPDMIFPSTACIIADKIGAKNCFAYDLMAACSGFLYSLSTASKFIETGTYKKIIIVEAQLAGEGASSRNSGYLVDTTLNDGFISNKSVKDYKKKIKVYDLGINAVKNFVKEYQVDCEWNECGKYFASSKMEDENIVNFNF